MTTVGLVILVAFLYAGYNVFVRVSGGAVPAGASTTILATIMLQAVALAASLAFLAWQAVQGGHSFRLGGNVYAWAAAAGLCIGGAEIAYFYLFGGIAAPRPDASIAIPAIVAGTIVISVFVAVVALGERMTIANALGVALVLAGILLLLRQPASN